MVTHQKIPSTMADTKVNDEITAQTGVRSLK